MCKTQVVAQPAPEKKKQEPVPVQEAQVAQKAAEPVQEQAVQQQQEQSVQQAVQQEVYKSVHHSMCCAWTPPYPLISVLFEQNLWSSFPFHDSSVFCFFFSFTY